MEVTRLRVRNIAEDVTEEDLEELFARYGSIVDLSYDDRRNSAFVEYADEFEAEEAIIELGGFEFFASIIAAVCAGGPEPGPPVRFPFPLPLIQLPLDTPDLVPVS